MDERKILLSQIDSLNLNLEQYIEIYKIIKLDSNIKIAIVLWSAPTAKPREIHIKR